MMYNQYPVQDWADLLPGIIHINERKTSYIHFYNKAGIDGTGKSVDEIRAMGIQYVLDHAHPETLKRVLTQRANDYDQLGIGGISSLFQQLRFDREADWQWYFSSGKFIKDDLVLSFTQRIDRLGHLTPKIEKILDDHYQMRQTLPKYLLLTKREREILKLITLGVSSMQIAEQLFISLHTVNTHRKNIKEKLDAKSLSEIVRIGSVFLDT
jgi:DNA-binding CsgD family transcriptional regulator